MGVQRRARTPALHCGHKQVPARQRQPSARPANGPMQRGGGRSAREPPPDAGTPPAVPGSATLLPCIVGRAFTPAGGALRQPGRILARSCAAPLSRLTPTLPVCGTRIMRRTPKRACILRPPHLLRLAVSAAGGARLRSPLQGSLPGGSPPKASPARGGGCAARRRRRGALPPCPTGILQNPAGPCPASVGDDACIVPEPPATHRKPQAAGEIARPTLRPGAGDNAEAPAIRQARRRADENHRPLRRGGDPHPGL